MPTQAKTRTGELPLSALHHHPKQIRETHEEDIAALAELVKAQGLLVRIQCFPHPTIEGDYMVVDGHHRLEACRRAELLDVPVEIHEEMTEAQALHIMLATGRGNKRTTDAEVSHGIQGLLDLGESVAAVAKGQSMKQKEVKARGWAATRKDGLGAAFMHGTVPLDVMMRFQELERESGDDELYERAIARISPEQGVVTVAASERIIEEAKQEHKVEQLIADLHEAGAKEAPEDARYRYAHWRYMGGSELSVAGHVEQGHYFLVNRWNAEVTWFEKREPSEDSAEPELSEEELAERKRFEELRTVLPNLSAGRVLTVVNAIRSPLVNAKTAQADRLARDVLARHIATVRYDYPGVMTFLGQVVGKDLEQLDSKSEVRQYLEKELSKLKLTQLAVILAMTEWTGNENGEYSTSFRHMSGYKRETDPVMYSSWRYTVFPYYQFLNKLGYELMPEEVEVMQMEAAKSPHRDLSLDLVEVPGEVTAECKQCKQTVVTGDGWAGICDHCLDEAADSED